MARPRKAKAATTAVTPTWKVQRPRLTPEQEGWQRRYRPKVICCPGKDAEWRLEPDLCDDGKVAYYCSWCGFFTVVARGEKGDA